MSASWALQQAVFATLSVSGDVQDVLGDPPRIFDAPPRDTAFPYLEIGGAAETPWNTATEKGSEHTLAITVWSRHGGHREAKEIADAVTSALDDATLALTGFTLVSLRHLSTDFSQEADGKTYRAVIRLRAMIEDA